MNSQYDQMFKIALVGTSGVGKSQQALKLESNFNQKQIQHKFPLPITSGVTYVKRTLQINKKKVKLQIWDRYGGLTYQNFEKVYYKGATGIIMVYDITDKKSFKDIQYWITQVQKYGRQDVIKILIGNRSEQQNNRQVSFEEGKQFALSRKVSFYQVQTKDCKIINQALFELAKQIVEKVINQKENQIKKQIKNNQNKAIDLDTSNQCKKCIQFQSQIKLFKQKNKKLQNTLLQQSTIFNSVLKQVQNDNSFQKISLKDQISQLKTKLQESNKNLIQINKIKELLEKTLLDQNVKIFKMDEQLQKYKKQIVNLKQTKHIQGDYVQKQKKTTQKLQMSQIFQDSDNQESPQNDIYTFTQGNQAKITSKDQRTMIKDSSLYPFNLFGKIVSKVYDKKQKVWKQMFGTGVLISAKIILTSAHNIYFDDCNLIASDIKFYCSTDMKDKSMSPQQGTKVIEFFLNPEYFNKISKKHQKYDIALLELEDSKFSSGNIRPLKIKASFNWEQQKNSEIMICGYSGHFQDSSFQLFSQTRSAFEQRNEFIYYVHTTYQGTSGAPLLLKHKDNSYSIIGVHKGTQAQNNYGILLSGFRKEELGWMSELIEKHGLEQSAQQIYQQSYSKLLKLNNLYQNMLIHKDRQIMELKMKA